MPRRRALLALLAAAGPAAALVPGPWSNRSLAADERTALLVKAMTLDEKLVMLHGPPKGPCCQCTTGPECAYVGNVAPNTRLDIPPITMNDGPQGFRDDKHPGTSTAWPSGLTMAASWDVDAAYAWGEGMGKEFYAKGSNVLLGPGLNVARVPRNGRNFEYLSGEDPVLGATLVGPVVRGIQSQKVVANAKHYVLNNQETNRAGVSAEVDERTRFEVYYPPFQAAVEAGVGSFMCGYNKIHGEWSCENPETLKHDLKETMGFRGYVMSDWGATHSASVSQGLDMEMPSADFMNPEVIKLALASGTITEDVVDESVSRILRPMFEVGVLDEPTSTWDWKRLQRNVTTPESWALARNLAAASTVLLKNEGGILPLRQGKKLALIGFAADNAVMHGGGSGSVVAARKRTPLQGISAVAGEKAVQFLNGSDIDAAAALAASADYAIVFVGTLSHEGDDRPSLSLDDGCDVDNEGQCGGNNRNQDAMVMAIAKANPRTIVVASVPGAVLLPWSADVPAILVNFMPGQEGGDAVADVLFGRVNPSAKLPVTFPNQENEIGFTPAQWPGLPDPKKPETAVYSEKLLVGYRYYEANNVTFTTGFPFGHGLSYTTFEYSGLAVQSSESAVTVSFSVRNTGKVPGAEVAQLYLGFPAAAGEPPLQLKGFRKTKVLAPKAAEQVVLELSPRDLSIWSQQAHTWAPVAGTFTVKVGSSSRDIRLEGSFESAAVGPLKVAFV